MPNLVGFFPIMIYEVFSFINSFTHQIFIQCPSCGKQYSECWKKNREQEREKSFTSISLYSSGKELIQIQINKYILW